MSSTAASTGAGFHYRQRPAGSPHASAHAMTHMNRPVGPVAAVAAAKRGCGGAGLGGPRRLPGGRVSPERSFPGWAGWPVLVAGMIGGCVGFGVGPIRAGPVGEVREVWAVAEQLGLGFAG